MLTSRILISPSIFFCTKNEFIHKKNKKDLETPIIRIFCAPQCQSSIFNHKTSSTTMIVKPKELGFFKLLLEMKGSIVPAIMPAIIFAAGVGVFACLALSHHLFGENTSEVLSLEFGPFTALGESLSSKYV